MKKTLKVISILTLLIFVRTSFALCAEQVYFYYSDPAGTPLAMSDASGTVVWRADYLPFGEETIDQATVQNNKMFVGKEKDSESGLYYFGARYMDPGAGRFASPDPIGAVNRSTGKINDMIIHDPQRLNIYTYGLNNPYRFIDVDGKVATEVGTIVGTFVAPGPGTLAGAAAGFLIDLSATAIVGYGVYKTGEAILNASQESETNKKSGQEGKTRVDRPEGYKDAVRGAEEWAKNNDLPASEGRRRFHRGVKANDPGAKATDNYSVNPETGDVLNPAGESAGNLNDVTGGK